MAVGSPALLEHSTSTATGSSGAGPRSTWPTRSTAAIAGVMVRSIDATAAGLGDDGAAWRRLFGRPSARLRRARRGPHAPGPARAAPPVAAGAVRDPGRGSRRPRWPAAGAASGRGRCSAASPRTPSARSSRPMSSAVGMALICACHSYGWPVARGGSRRDHRRAGRRRDRARRAGSRPVARCARSSELPDADAVVLDLSPRGGRGDRRRAAAGRVARAYRALPPRARRRSRSTSRSRAGSPGRRRGLPPGRAPCTRSARSRRSSPPSARSTAGGCPSVRSCSSASSTWPTRARSARRRASRLGLRPRPERLRRRRDRGGDRPDRALRARPARADRRAARSARPPSSPPPTPTTWAATSSPAPTRHAQILFRPRLALDPYSTGIPGVYICSAATPPGAGVHGMNGYNAAASVLRSLA